MCAGGGVCSPNCTPSPHPAECSRYVSYVLFLPCIIWLLGGDNRIASICLFSFALVVLSFVSSTCVNTGEAASRVALSETINNSTVLVAKYLVYQINISNPEFCSYSSYDSASWH